MSYNKDTVNNLIRRFAALIILAGLLVGVGLPLFLHNFMGLIVGPIAIVIGMVILTISWWKRPRWENRDPA